MSHRNQSCRQKQHGPTFDSFPMGAEEEEDDDDDDDNDNDDDDDEENRNTTTTVQTRM